MDSESVARRRGGRGFGPVLLLALVATAAGGEEPALWPTPYVDGTFCFALRPPAGWQVAPLRESAPRAMVLLRMIGPTKEGAWPEASLSLIDADRATPMAQLVESAARAMELEFSEVEVLSQQTQEIAGRPGGLLSARYMAGGLGRVRLLALIENGPKQHWQLAFNGRLEDRHAGELLFNQMLASFELPRPRLKEEALTQALDAGQRWLATLRPEALREAVVARQFFRIDRDGKAIGVLSIQESTDTWRHHPGIRVIERGWLFEPDGRMLRSQANLFISDDLRHEYWQATHATLTPEKGSQPALLQAATEEGLRNDDILLSNQAPALNQPVQTNAALRLPKTFLPWAVDRLIGRLLTDRASKRTLAFTTFDHQIVDLRVRIVELEPVKAKRGKGRSAGRFRLIARDGVCGAPRTMWFDQSGRWVKAEEGGLTITAAKEQDITAQFGPRVERAGLQFEEMERRYEEQQQRFRPGGQP